jgi:NAD(P)-dependent dehydrogenase (short-subunit alcohol dehydrogenase family)
MQGVQEASPREVTFDFSGKTALVTGATKGIGRDVALAFAEAGCSIAATGRNPQALATLAAEIEEKGAECSTFKADLANVEDCHRMAEFFLRETGGIDILINNAGISFPERIIDLEVQHWDTTIAVNLRAPVLVTKIIASHMMEKKKGTIVNISSNAGVAGIEEHAAYCASKFGLLGLTKVMAVELGPFNIRVNAVAPTVVLTPMGTKVWGDPAKADPVKARIPLGRFAYPKEVTAVVLFLASDASSMIHGETVLIDGGVNAKLY